MIGPRSRSVSRTVSRFSEVVVLFPSFLHPSASLRRRVLILALLRLRHLLLLHFLQLAPQDLAGPALGQRAHELYLAGVLVGRHLLFGPRHYVFGARLLP